MRCISAASAFALLLAPALATVPVAPPAESKPVATSSAYIIFDLPPDFPADHLDFAISVRESSDPCGRANVFIDNQTLPDGGAGIFTARQETTFKASWNSTCIDVAGGPKEQVMALSVNSVSGIAVKDLEISLRFRQVAPMTISHLRGPASMASLDGRGPQAGDSGPSPPARLAADLDEIDALRTRAAEIHRIIRTRERLIAESYVWARGDAHPLKECETIGCVIKSLLDKAGGMISSLLHGGSDRDRHHRWRGPPRWWRHRHHRPGGDGGSCGHGDHPMPPWRRPHFRHGPPKAPAPPTPSTPPTEKPDGGPGHPPTVNGDSSPPNLSSPGPETAPIPFTENWSVPSLNRPLHGLGSAWNRRPDHGRPGPGHHHNSQKPHRRGSHWPLLAKISLCFVILGVIVALIHHRCRRARAEKLATSWRQRFTAHRESRRRRRAERKAAVKRAVARLGESLGRLARRGWSDADDEGKTTMLLQERRRPGCEAGSPAMVADTTVEDEIAGLRVAADMVSDIIAAEEGRATRQQQQAQQRQQRPQSATAAFAGYATGRPSMESRYSGYSEALPAYEATESPPPALHSFDEDGVAEQDDLASPASSIVADGFMYTPSSSSFVPGSRGSSVFGAGSADALGDTKN